MLRDDGRPAGRCQRALEPGQPALAEPAARMAGNERVEHDQANFEVVDHVLHETALTVEMTVGRKGCPQRLAVVMVADGEVNRHGERCQDFGKQSVLRRSRVVGQVTGGHDRIGWRGSARILRTQRSSMRGVSTLP